MYTSWLDELHMECAQMFVEARFVEARYAQGRERETIPLLRELIRRYPLHETSYRQLMSALHRIHRRAEALETFHRAKRVLSSELGVEPCRASRTLYHRILRDEAPMPARV
ncbi:BTAD domain-containing putative transcriptional regulator [Amycolatopsis orientalis]|uniref:BTAD domain-containing putative transcriptional regulator n=1 Tax=Amycolatopsis orientalis TaxID=31958 RepID=UPI0003A46783|nr:BTAD domain-containing putative transcriptional regulator [Amycolatopsis orientalis]